MKVLVKETGKHGLHAQVAHLFKYLPKTVYATCIPGGDRGVTTARGYRSGTPDFLLVADNRAIFIELKGTRGRMSETQKHAHDLIKAAGGYPYVARSLDEVMAILGAHEIKIGKGAKW